MHPSVALMLHNPRQRQAIERTLARRGRGGDTMVAHINPAEALMLRRAGGSGTINPRTGLPEFMDAEGAGGAGNNAVGSAGNHVGGQASGGYGGGQGAGNAGTGLRGPLGEGGLPVHTGAAWAAGDPGYGGTRPSAAGGVGTNYASASAQYANRSFGDKLLGALLGLIPGLSYAERPIPGQAWTSAGGTWHSGFNPGQAAGSLAGLMAPGAGLLGSWLGGAAYHALGGQDIALGGLLGAGAPGGTQVGSQGPGNAGLAQALANAGMSPAMAAAIAAKARPATAAPPEAPPTSAAQGNPALMPLMSQAPAGNLIGSAYGPVPGWALRPYQLGLAPTSYPIPSFAG
jgi:hypothetical protein